MSHLISPSILSADFANLERDIKMLNGSECDWIHCDIMDGSFVPNISFGFPILKAVSKHAEKPLDVHLMIENPGNYVQDFKDAGANILTVHEEAVTHLDRVIQQIRAAGMKPGVSLNPSSPVESLRHVLPQLDLVLIMSVNPGFGGQKFIEYTFDKVRRLKALIQETGSHALIEIDGGVGPHNLGKLVEAGADVLVAGAAIFKTPDPVATITQMKNIIPGLTSV